MFGDLHAVLRWFFLLLQRRIGGVSRALEAPVETVRLDCSQASFAIMIFVQIFFWEQRKALKASEILNELSWIEVFPKINIDIFLYSLCVLLAETSHNQRINRLQQLYRTCKCLSGLLDRIHNVIYPISLHARLLLASQFHKWPLI